MIYLDTNFLSDYLEASFVVHAYVPLSFSPGNMNDTSEMKTNNKVSECYSFPELNICISLFSQ